MPSLIFKLFPQMIQMCRQRWELLVSLVTFLYFKCIFWKSSQVMNVSLIICEGKTIHVSTIYFCTDMYICTSIFIYTYRSMWICIYCSSTLPLQLPSTLSSIPICISTCLPTTSGGRQIGWPSLEKKVKFASEESNGIKSLEKKVGISVWPREPRWPVQNLLWVRYPFL